MTRGLHRWIHAYWRGDGGPIGTLLAGVLWPAEMLFGGVVALRSAVYDRGWVRPEEPRIPVISVGNLAVGGVGKTPVAAWIASQLRAAGFRPAIVLRGYGDDEVLVHRELNPAVPVYVAPRRAEGVARAAYAGHDVAVLDDGFQHRALARDLDVVLVSADSWGRAPRLLPRGPWRERITALRRARLVIVTRKAASPEAAQHAEQTIRVATAAPIARCRLLTTGFIPVANTTEPVLPLEWIRGRSVLAVAAIGDPESFSRQLEALGADVELMTYPDHHDFDHKDVGAIIECAHGRPVVMTRKEAVKVRGLLPSDIVGVFAHQDVEFESSGPMVRDLILQAARR